MICCTEQLSELKTTTTATTQKLTNMICCTSNTNLGMCPVCFLLRPPLPANNHLFPSTFLLNNHNPHPYILQSQSTFLQHHNHYPNLTFPDPNIFVLQSLSKSLFFKLSYSSKYKSLVLFPILLEIDQNSPL